MMKILQMRMTKHGIRLMLTKAIQGRMYFSKCLKAMVGLPQFERSLWLTRAPGLVSTFKLPF